MRHNYEQEFGDLWGLPEKKDFPLIFPKHWWSRFEQVKGLGRWRDFKNLGLEPINGRFEYWNFSKSN